MDPPKIILPDSEVDIKTLDKSVINKWRWEWLDYTIQLDLGGEQLVSLINYLFNSLKIFSKEYCHPSVDLFLIFGPVGGSSAETPDGHLWALILYDLDG